MRIEPPPPDDEQPVYRVAWPREPEPSPPPPRRRPPPWRRLLLGKLPLETETSLFIFVSLLDFFMTYWLLMHRGGGLRFVESNPVARYFIDSWGPVKGMLGFKLSVVTFICVVAQLIALKRRDLGRAVLWIGTLGTAAVVIYSLRLYLQHA